MVSDCSRGEKRRKTEDDIDESSDEDTGRRSPKRPRISDDDAAPESAPSAGVIITVGDASVNHRSTARPGELLIRLRVPDTIRLRAAIAEVPSDSDDQMDGVQVYVEESADVDSETFANDEDGNGEDGNYEDYSDDDDSDNDSSDPYDDITVIVRAWGANATWRNIAIQTPGLRTDGAQIIVEGRAADAVRNVAYLVKTRSTRPPPSR